MTGGNIIKQIAIRAQNRCDTVRDRGASLVEYGLLLVLVFLVAFVSVKLFGDSVVAVFDSGGDSFDAGGSGSSN